VNRTADDAEQVQALAQVCAADLRRQLAHLDAVSVDARENGRQLLPAFHDNRARLTAALRLRERLDAAGGGQCLCARTFPKRNYGCPLHGAARNGTVKR
jgi:hypothetical protein